MANIMRLGGGGVSGGNELIVTAPTGSIVTVAKDGVVKTTTERNGVWTFKGLEAGDWTVTATLGGKIAVETATVGEEISIIYKPVAKTSPTSGVTYTNGLSGLDAATVNLFSEAISNNTSINKDTSTVYIDFDAVHRKLSVGDQVSLTLYDTAYNFDIIGFNHDTLTTATEYGAETATGLAGMTLQMHDLFATTYAMNSSDASSGGWKDSLMRTSTMVTMKAYLPDDWEGIIKAVNKTSSIGSGATTGTETVSDECFLLAEIEIFGSTTSSVSGEGSQYAYYKAGNSKIKNMSGSPFHWWERSPFRGSPAYFCAVINGNPNGSGASAKFGVSFAFCV